MNKIMNDQQQLPKETLERLSKVEKLNMTQNFDTTIISEKCYQYIFLSFIGYYACNKNIVTYK